MYSYTSEIPYAANTGERANQLPDAAASIKQGHTHRKYIHNNTFPQTYTLFSVTYIEMLTHRQQVYAARHTDIYTQTDSISHTHITSFYRSSSLHLKV